MGRPVNSDKKIKVFGSGTGRLAVSYHNGTTTVTGYIVKQLGTNKFKVTTNGTTMYVCKLAQTTGLATTLTAGYMTILVTPHGGAAEHVKKLYGEVCVTTEGFRRRWQLTATTAAGQSRLTVQV